VWSKYSNGLKWRGLGFSPSSLFEWTSPIQKQLLGSRASTNTITRVFDDLGLVILWRRRRLATATDFAIIRLISLTSFTFVGVVTLDVTRTAWRSAVEGPQPELCSVFHSWQESPGQLVPARIAASRSRFSQEARSNAKPLALADHSCKVTAKSSLRLTDSQRPTWAKNALSAEAALT
jgi:hypothetical protein